MLAQGTGNTVIQEEMLANWAGKGMGKGVEAGKRQLPGGHVQCFLASRKKKLNNRWDGGKILLMGPEDVPSQIWQQRWRRNWKDGHMKKKWQDWCQLSKTKIPYVLQNKMQKTSPYLLGVQRTLWGLTGRQNILLLCFIKPDVEPPKCLPQTQLFWRSSWFLPMLARHHDSPTLALSRLLHCSQRIVGSQLWLSADQTLAGTLALSLTTACFISPSCTRFLSSALPAGFVERLFCPFPFAAWRACLLSFKEFKGWLTRTALPASFHLLSLFRVSGGLLATRAHLGSASCPSSCGQQPGDSPVGFIVWMPLLLKNRGAGIHFHLFSIGKFPVK